MDSADTNAARAGSASAWNGAGEPSLRLQANPGRFIQFGAQTARSANRHSEAPRYRASARAISEDDFGVTDGIDCILNGRRYLIPDRDPLFTLDFQTMLATVGVRSVKLPPRSPNLNAHAERLVRSIK
jgi:hypothetical protein